MSLSRYWHTVRYLSPQQVFGRLWFQIHHPTPDLRAAPAVRRAVRAWTSSAWRTPSLVSATEVTFLQQSASIASPAIWQDASRGRLWLYNLHYGDDLTACGAESRRAWHETFVRRWIDENPPGHGAGWEPYPTSLRIVNWITWLLRSQDVPACADLMRASLAIQARWLSHRLEHHIRGNHLWANGKAMLMAGVYFEGAEAEAWRRRGLAILSAELSEQVLADGGHFERSPMYHAIVLEDILDLIQLAALFPGAVPSAFVERLRTTAPRMVRWLRVMSHPDGDIAFFNDAAFDIAPPLRVVEAYAGTVGVAVDSAPLGAVDWLADSGYVRLSNTRAVVLCDVAPVGPDYQPGHAHADTLSFELSLDGRRLVVNGGTSTYTPGPERTRQRATPAHNTVEVDGCDSSEVWGGFRVARRARPHDVRVGGDATACWAEAAHDGYRHTPGRVTHRRRWDLTGTALTVTDTLEGRYATATARFLIHPDVASGLDRILHMRCEPEALMQDREARWHPQFGVSRATRVREVDLPQPRMTTLLTWV